MRISLFLTFVFNALFAMAQKEYVNPRPVGYSDAVIVTGGRTIHISGQVPVDAKGNLVGKGDFKAQTVQVFENLKVVLEKSGASFSDVVKINMYVVNCKPEHVAIIREVRKSYLEQKNPPASTLVGVTSLVDPEFMLEIELVAVVE